MQSGATLTGTAAHDIRRIKDILSIILHNAE
jgi:hypothetical protein